MQLNLVKHMLYMFRCCSGTAEYTIIFEEPNKRMRHMFVVKDTCISYNFMIGDDILYGLNCTNLDLLEIKANNLTPILFKKVSYLYDTKKIYSLELLNIRYEIELLVCLSKEQSNSLFFSIVNDDGETDVYYIDKAMYWYKELDDAIEVYTASFYDAEKVFGRYSIGWVYGKAPYQSVFRYYSSKETLAKVKGVEFRKIK